MSCVKPNQMEYAQGDYNESKTRLNFTKDRIIDLLEAILLTLVNVQIPVDETTDWTDLVAYILNTYSMNTYVPLHFEHKISDCVVINLTR